MPAEFISADPSDDGNVVNTLSAAQSTLAKPISSLTQRDWANAVLDKSRLHHQSLIAGTHIVIDEPAPEGMYYVEAPQDGRAVFVRRVKP